jgi:hypothetical protein
MFDYAQRHIFEANFSHDRYGDMRMDRRVDGPFIPTTDLFDEYEIIDDIRRGIHSINGNHRRVNMGASRFHLLKFTNAVDLTVAPRVLSLDGRVLNANNRDIYVTSHRENEHEIQGDRLESNAAMWIGEPHNSFKNRMDWLKLYRCRNPWRNTS